MKGSLVGTELAEKLLHRMPIHDHVHRVTTMPPRSVRGRMPDSRTSRPRRRRRPRYAESILPKSSEKDKKETSHCFPPRYPKAKSSPIGSDGAARRLLGELHRVTTVVRPWFGRGAALPPR